MVPLSVLVLQGIAGVALSRHHKGCTGGGPPIRYGLATCGRRGTFSTPQGVRWGCGRYPSHARRLPSVASKTACMENSKHLGSSRLGALGLSRGCARIPNRRQQAPPCCGRQSCRPKLPWTCLWHPRGTRWSSLHATGAGASLRPPPETFRRRGVGYHPLAATACLTRRLSVEGNRQFAKFEIE